MLSLTPRQYITGAFQTDFLKFIKTSRVHERDGGVFIPVQNLNRAQLAHVAPEHLTHFFYALAMTTMIDSMVERYFIEDYPAFAAEAQYPRFEQGLTGERVYPWTITALAEGDLILLDAYIRFFLEDARNLIARGKYSTLTWDSLTAQMRHDPDLSQGIPAPILLNIIKPS